MSRLREDVSIQPLHPFYAVLYADLRNFLYRPGIYYNASQTYVTSSNGNCMEPRLLITRQRLLEKAGYYNAGQHVTTTIIITPRIRAIYGNTELINDTIQILSQELAKLIKTSVPPVRSLTPMHCMFSPSYTQYYETLLIDM